MKIKTLIGASLLALSMSSYAGFKEFTMHSRANCAGFNESISWHFRHFYDLITWTVHTSPKASYRCEFNSGGWQKTWRAAALHYTEGYGGWTVKGFHWGLDPYGNPIKLTETIATDCNIYDGWWDV